jgi:asparagine synthase (glutamine-hydrolysing)
VFKLARENGVTVMLDGQGADELLAGYVPYSTEIYLRELYMRKHLWTLAVEAKKFKAPIARIILPIVLHQLVGVLKKSPRLYHAMKPLRSQKNHGPGNKGWLKPDLFKRYEDQSYFTSNQQRFMFEEHEYLNNYLYQLTFCNNLQALLKYEDRNSMAFSVEGRIPFLDYRLVEFLFTLPSCFKMHNGYSKYVFREGMNKVLPEKIRRRITKLGFSTPESLWQKTALRPLIEQALEDPKLRAYIDPDRSKNHLSRLHQLQQNDFTPWRWVNLSLWMKSFNLEPKQS